MASIQGMLTGLVNQSLSAVYQNKVESALSSMKARNEVLANQKNALYEKMKKMSETNEELMSKNKDIISSNELAKTKLKYQLEQQKSRVESAKARALKYKAQRDKTQLLHDRYKTSQREKIKKLKEGAKKNG